MMANDAELSNKKEIVSRECRHVVYCPPPKDGYLTGHTKDLHVIKLQEKDKDGNYHPRVYLDYDRKYPIYVTKPAVRKTHTDKKEFEKLTNLDAYPTRECDKVDTIRKALGIRRQLYGLKAACDSPYVYGTDIPFSSIIKEQINKTVTAMGASTLAVFDVETNMFSVREEIIIACLSFKDRVVQVVDRKFFTGHCIGMSRKEADEYIIRRTTEEWLKWLSEDIIKRKIKLNIVLVDEEIDIVKTIFKYAHEWKPDVIGGWNVVFDIKKCVAAAEHAGVDIADIICDPSVPKPYRYFEIDYGATHRKTASGKHKPLSEHEQWITFKCPASFEIQDTMRVFKAVRVGQPDEISYTLDYQLQKTLKRGKLYTGSVTTDNGTDWHRAMQKEFPFEYMAYNGRDCIGIEEHDEVTFDHAFAIPALLDNTPFKKTPSVPTRQTNYYHFLALEHGKVIASTGTKPWPDYMRKCMALSDWIVMLEPIYLTHEGARCVEENHLQCTNIYVACADIDVTAAYPTASIVMNVSRDTQTKFIISIDGIEEHVVRMTMLNFSGGPVNSAQIMEDIYNFPFIDDIVDYYDAMDSYERNCILEGKKLAQPVSMNREKTTV